MCECEEGAKTPDDDMDPQAYQEMLLQMLAQAMAGQQAPLHAPL